MSRSAWVVLLAILAGAHAGSGYADEVEGGTVLEMRDFAFRVPGDDPWSVARMDGRLEQIVLRRNPGEDDPRDLIEIKVIRNLIDKRKLRRLPARENADHIRLLEETIMQERGVKAGMYTLHDVRKSDHMVGDHLFYAMTYRVEAGGNVGLSALYLLFPKNTGNKWFIMAHCTERIPGDAGIMNSERKEFLELLASIELQP